ncbi:hypothetical protein HYS97_00950 [Candidatus Daviesbacteria bacterium]|nr:hypothetical protein [Candidatus Daviesbacteria bacterium]
MKDFLRKNLLVLFFIFASILLRLIPHPPNFTPVVATAIFAGAKLSFRQAVIISLLALAISDYLLLYINPFLPQMFNFSKIQPIGAMFHSTTLFVWGAVLISAFIGSFIKKRLKAQNIFFGAIISSLQFFIITNFGVWAGGYYGYTLDGLIQSYIMGIPFYKFTLLGDLIYTIFLFGTYALASKNLKRYKLN